MSQPSDEDGASRPRLSSLSTRAAQYSPARWANGNMPPACRTAHWRVSHVAARTWHTKRRAPSSELSDERLNYLQQSSMQLRSKSSASARRSGMLKNSGPRRLRNPRATASRA
jgi:hypothetical protein